MTSVNTEYAELQPLEVQQFWNESCGYGHIWKINGELVALGAMIYSVGIIVGLDTTGYRCRYCYETFDRALQALADWTQEGGDEPKNYIKRK